MATMRTNLRRIEPSWITLWAIGLICGVLVMVGIDQVRHSSDPVSSAAVVSNPANTNAMAAVANQVAGMRDAQVVEPIVGNAQSALDLPRMDETTYYRKTSAIQPDVTGGRLGGLTSSDTANDAIVKASVGRVSGPGEGLNQYQDTTGYGVGSVQRVVGPGEGRTQYVDSTQYAIDSHLQPVGPGEGLNSYTLGNESNPRAYATDGGW